MMICQCDEPLVRKSEHGDGHVCDRCGHWFTEESGKRLMQRKLRAASQAPRPRRTLAPLRRIKIGRNAPCPCGSGHKYKRCCA